jgi:exopolysaccharide production protein ExoQ
MPPTLGVIAWVALLLLLLRYDQAKDPRVTSALWLPLIWIFIQGSRLPAQWLGMTPTSAAEAFEEGSGLDRSIFLLLIAVAIRILTARRLRWPEVFARNWALALFVLFALASVTWSDFPFVSFKRWFRDLGTYIMVLLVLTEPHPLGAISLLLRRLSYFLVFSSVVLIKYHPELAVIYNPWDGRPEYVGSTTSKNMLGAACLLSGLFFFGDTLRRWGNRGYEGARRIVFINIALIGLTLWLLKLSESATSRACLAIGCLIIALARARWVVANPRVLTVGIPVAIVVSGILEFMFDVSTMVADFLGRDPTLHGRTGIWSVVLAQQTNPLLGVGYQTFWLGDRLTAVWGQLGAGFLNEAHNGYLEIYLNLGLVGVALFGVFLLASYRTVCRQFTALADMGSLGLALWVVMVFYNRTESGYGGSVLWSILLLGVMAVPQAWPGGSERSKANENGADSAHTVNQSRSSDGRHEPFVHVARSTVASMPYSVLKYRE